MPKITITLEVPMLDGESVHDAALRFDDAFRMAASGYYAAGMKHSAAGHDEDAERLMDEAKWCELMSLAALDAKGA